MGSDRISVTIHMPGKFAAYFSGTGIGQGQYNESDPIEAMVYRSWNNAAKRRISTGYYLVLFLEGSSGMVQAALDLFLDCAETCVVINTNNRPYDPHEKQSAKCFMERLKTAIEGIG